MLDDAHAEPEGGLIQHIQLLLPLQEVIGIGGSIEKKIGSFGHLHPRGQLVFAGLK